MSDWEHKHTVRLEAGRSCQIRFRFAGEDKGLVYLKAGRFPFVELGDPARNRFQRVVLFGESLPLGGLVALASERGRGRIGLEKLLTVPQNNQESKADILYLSQLFC